MALDDMIVLALALAWDLVLGEPPAFIHPVVWMGRIAAFLEARAPSAGALCQAVYGALTVGMVVAASVLVSWLSLLAAWELAGVWFVLVSAFLLKCSFSLRELQHAAKRVRRALLAGRLTEAKGELRALVSRDTSQMDEQLVASAAVESVAENACDSFVAPLFFYLILGIPGALAYRAINTLDAMIGYHGRYEFLGKAAARLDDLLNLIPARLTALLIVAAAGLTGLSARGAWQIMWRDHACTESPNAGWTMSAAAGALRVRLEKVGHYRLGDSMASPSSATIDQALRLLWGVAALWVALSVSIEGFRYVLLNST